MSTDELKEIQSGYRALLKAAGNNVDRGDYATIRKALDLAIKAYGKSRILTGVPQILHALSVARIVAGEMGLGLTSIITSLLHDSFGKLDISPEQLKKEFGEETVEILKGFSRITSLESMQSSYQAENFRKLLLSLAEDVRVILIKLVERLEYMRNLDNAPEKEKLPVASETYFLYAPDRKSVV